MLFDKVNYLFVLSLFVSSVLVADDTLAEKIFNALEKPEKNYTFDIDLSYHGISRSVSSFSDWADSNVNDVLHLNVKATLWPRTYNIKLSYVENITDNVDRNLYNPLNLDAKTQNTSASFVPWYDKSYGGLGVFYTSAEQNSQYFNRSGGAINLVSYVRDASQPSNWNLLPYTSSLASNQGLQVKEKASYTGIKYLLPEKDYLPKGSNVYYSMMDRSSVYFATFGTDKVLISLSGTGRLYGFGLQRSLNELPNDTLSLDLVQLSQGGFSEFPAVHLSEYTTGATYKTKNWYLKGVALIYVSEAFSQTVNNKTLFIPQQRDIFYSLAFGLIY